MSLFGAHLTLLIGSTRPAPAPAILLEAMESLEVRHSDDQASGFQLVLRANRGPQDQQDFAWLTTPLLRPFSRVLMLVTFGAIPQVLVDGVITHQQLSPGNGPGEALLTVTGEDMSLMMDLEERSAEHPGQPEHLIALKIIGDYADYGLVPKVIPPPTVDVPLMSERTPVQQGTDLDYLRSMAARFGYLFYIKPGPAPFSSTAYWGPPERISAPQKAISINLGPQTNAQDLDFQYDALAPARVDGWLQDRLTGRLERVQATESTRPALSREPALTTQTRVRTQQFRHSGLSIVQAQARVQGETDRSVDAALTATGSLDASRYESLLQPRALVGVRGVGASYDGLYYVRRVTHKIRIGAYRQEFSLAREGLGSTTAVVTP